MADDHSLFYYGIATVLLVPPVWILIAAWLQWASAKAKPVQRLVNSIPTWRARFLRYGLFCGSGAMICLLPISFHLSQYDHTPLPGYWRIAFRISFYLWIFSFICAAFGKGAGRSRLIWWGIVMPLCLFAIVFESMMD
jgi:hypothetical protein